MTKIDYENGKKAVEDIVKNSAKVEKILTTITDLNKQLGDATNEYQKLSENLSKLEKKLTSNVNDQFENLSNDFTKSVEVKLAERLSEVSLRLRDLKDEQSNTQLVLDKLNEQFEIKLKSIRLFIFFWGAVFSALTVGAVLYFSGFVF